MDSSEEEKKGQASEAGSSNASNEGPARATLDDLLPATELRWGRDEDREEAQPEHVDELIIPYKAKGQRLREECAVVQHDIPWSRPATRVFEKGTLFLDSAYVEGLPVLSHPWSREETQGSDEAKDDGASYGCIPAPPAAEVMPPHEEGSGKRSSRRDEKGVLGLVPRRYSDSDSEDDSDGGRYLSEAKETSSRRKYGEDSDKDSRSDWGRRHRRFDSSTDSNDSDSKRWSQRDQSLTPPPRHLQYRRYDPYADSKLVSRYDDVKY